MKTIVEIKEGVWSAAASIVFLLSLCAFTIWCRVHFGKPPLLAVWFFCGIWILSCWLPIDAILHPKSALLAIDGELLVWSVRALEGGGKEITQGAVPLKSIRLIEIGLPKIAGQPNARNYSCAEMVLIDDSGKRHQLPSELFPGVYQKKIITAVKERHPAIEVSEVPA